MTVPLWLAACLSLLGRVSAAPQFPIHLVGEACEPGAPCPFVVDWTLRADGTWADPSGREGTWRSRPGQVLLAYAGGSPTYWGSLNGTCVDGYFGPQVGSPVGQWRACVAP